mmetsp:Transcript_33883/g.82146  ORF Transcript_33883/g.82146 Transcript_33883/m.82146 type:complete len:260 (+) Transcript_33883:337-1116(+)
MVALQSKLDTSTPRFVMEVDLILASSSGFATLPLSLVGREATGDSSSSQSSSGGGGGTPDFLANAFPFLSRFLPLFSPAKEKITLFSFPSTPAGKRSCWVSESSSSSSGGVGAVAKVSSEVEVILFWSITMLRLKVFPPWDSCIMLRKLLRSLFVNLSAESKDALDRAPDIDGGTGALECPPMPSPRDVMICLTARLEVVFDEDDGGNGALPWNFRILPESLPSFGGASSQCPELLSSPIMWRSPTAMTLLASVGEWDR